MKIKEDFVTNSSSTSFCCWGMEIEIEELSEKMLKGGYDLYLIRKTDLRFQYAYVKDEDDISYNDFKNEIDESNKCYTEFIEEYLRSLGFNCIFSYDSLLVGRSPFSIGEDETHRSFLEILIADLEKVGFQDVTISDICTHVEY